MTTIPVGRKHHVLCIDDYEPGLRVRRAMLEQWGYFVTTASCGEDGLSVLKNTHVDAVVVDYSMPGMDGQVVAQAVKARWPDVGIIILSGEPSVPLAAVRSADAFIPKGTAGEPLRPALQHLLAAAPTPIRRPTLQKTRAAVSRLGPEVDHSRVRRRQRGAS